MHLLEIVYEFSLMTGPLELLKFAQLLSFGIDPNAEWHSLLYDAVDSLDRPFDVFILDFCLNLQHVEAPKVPFKCLRGIQLQELTVNQNADLITDFLCLIYSVSDH